MTIYRTRDNQEFERYDKFTNYTAVTADVTWIPLLVSKNRVRYFESSQLVEVKSPFDSGMVYCYPAIPQNFDSGLLYTCAEPPTYYTVPENIYPQALWLGIANGILEMSKRSLDMRMAVAASELVVAA